MYKIITITFFVFIINSCHSSSFLDATPIPAIHYAAYKGDIKRLKKILKKTDIELKDHRNRTALHLAVEGQQLEAVKFLIENGANVNADKGKGWTPLFYAAWIGNKDISEYLIINGANIEVNENAHSKPLAVASEFGHLEVVKLLLKYGADVNGKGNFRNYTALHDSYKHYEITKLLLDSGANPNTLTENYTNNQGETDYGETPLQNVILWHDVEMVKLYLQYDINLNVKRGDGLTTIELAKKTGKEEIVELLEEYQSNKEK